MMTAPFGCTNGRNLGTVNEIGLAVDVTKLGTLLSLVHIMLLKWLINVLRDSMTDRYHPIFYKNND